MERGVDGVSRLLNGIGEGGSGWRSWGFEVLKGHPRTGSPGRLQGTKPVPR